ncbi:MAG: von Willebrand factor type A domain-containing protein [Flavobacterium sp.]
MKHQDKLFEAFKKVSDQEENKDFPAMEKVWTRVEEKLDRKKERKAIILWQRIGIAASVLLIATLGYIWMQPDTIPLEQPIVVQPDTEIQDTEKGIVLEETPTHEELIEKREPITKQKVTAEEKIYPVTDEALASTPHENVYVEEVSVSEVPLAKTKDIQEVATAEIITSKVSLNPVSGMRTISGVVLESGQPLPGATVLVKGTSRGTQTDFDGKFSIQAKEGEQLEVSYIGMKTEIIAVSKTNNNLAINLNEDATTLSEVVVVGYGRVKKSTAYSSAVSVVSSEKVSRKKDKISTTSTVTASPASPQTHGYVSQVNRNTQAIQSLQGQLTGLSVSSGSGAPGSGDKIVIRGISSVNSSSEPLYIINGLPVSSGAVKMIKAEDIKNIQVLKDANATALYGNQGQNGVIIITTKKKLTKRELKKLQKLQEEGVVPPPGNPWNSFDGSHNEDYEVFEENAFTSPRQVPLSTFSIDVDNASYTNIRRMINNGQKVTKDAVRIEEMINFFKYDYEGPKDQHPFAIHTEYSEAPWNAKHQLLRVGLQGKDVAIDALPASNLVFLIDVSGSMDTPNRLPLVIESLKILTGQLREKDRVSIVVYAGAAGLVLPSTSGAQKELIYESLNRLKAGGSTAGGAGIELAYKVAQEHFIKGGNNRVIIATDGDFNVGMSSNKDMEDLFTEKRKTGLFLTCLGYGMGNYKDSKLQTLSQKGNGNYAYIDNIQEAHRFLAKEFKGSMFAIAKDVKIQMEFNPAHVQAYRLIGYETRKLRDEDFVNDAIDAGELGVGHTVTALYEIIPHGVESSFNTSIPELKYSNPQTKPSGNFPQELGTVKFRYKKPDGDKSTEMVHIIKNQAVPLTQSSPDFKFCSAVAWFGLKLRDSQWIENKNTKDIIQLAKQGLSNDPEGYRSEFIRLVQTQP